MALPADGSLQEPVLDVELHAKYWQRCLKSLLPTAYISSDSSRTSLAFFILSALDLLGKGADTLPESERAAIRDWILRCQHPHGGFVGSPTHRYDDAFYVDLHAPDGRTTRQERDPANINATFFCLLMLGFVDGLKFVKRVECLQWLSKLQREEGSFGEFLGKDGSIEGGRDTRHCLCAMGIRRVLRADLDRGQGYEDINITTMVNHVALGATYDGGFSESPSHEAHGYTYCSLGALSLAGQLPTQKSSTRLSGNQAQPEAQAINLSAATRWLVSRQLPYDDSQAEENDDESDDTAEQHPTSLADMKPLVAQCLTDESVIGYNGRFNKPADTCYCWWAVGSLDILEQVSLLQVLGLRRYLILKTQHRIGGFGKAQGYPPDIYHSYLGLATLSAVGEQKLKSIDSELCVSTSVVQGIDREMERLLGKTASDHTK